MSIKPYGALFEDADGTRRVGAKGGDAVDTFTISKKASWALKLALGGEKLVEEIRSPIDDAKAVKNDTELEGVRQCHIRDGAALIEYFAWLEDHLVNKGGSLNEAKAADKLESFRKKQQDYREIPSAPYHLPVQSKHLHPSSEPSPQDFFHAHSRTAPR